MSFLKRVEENMATSPGTDARSQKRRLNMACMVALALLLFIPPTAAIASCGTGQIPGPGDVTDIIVTQTGCGSTLTPGPALNLDCSKFWFVLVKGSYVEYSQYNLENEVGDYSLANSLFSAARNILSVNDFFNLNPPPQKVPTDTALMAISVWYCSSERSIKVYSFPQVAPAPEPQVAKLFSELRNLIAKAAKTKLDANPHDLPETFSLWF